LYGPCWASAIAGIAIARTMTVQSISRRMTIVCARRAVYVNGRETPPAMRGVALRPRYEA
jgi:hypothetical protein